MSAEPNPKIHMSEEEYLAFEHESETKHEYIGGEVYAMVGASPNHSRINAIIVELTSNHSLLFSYQRAYMSFT